MLSGKKIILFGAGLYGYRALKYFKEKVYCFADNKTAGQTYMEKPVISFVELLSIYNEYDVVISVSKNYENELVMQCEQAGVPYYLLYNVMAHERSTGCEANPQLKKFKNIHKGKRCFLIGNGPSLTAEDLTLLYNNNEITFACNAISKIFSKTHWRPKYYAAQDRNFFQFHCDMLVSTDAEYKFYAEPYGFVRHLNPEKVINKLLNDKSDVFFYRNESNADNDKTTEPLFSENVAKAIYMCGTVMYTMFQIAFYMGVSEIYLLGVDGGMASTVNHAEYLSLKRHFYEEDENWVKTFKYGPSHTSDFIKYNVLKAYQSANKFTRNNGCRIINASRSSSLDTFERIRFDSLFGVGYEY